MKVKPVTNLECVMQARQPSGEWATCCKYPSINHASEDAKYLTRNTPDPVQWRLLDSETMEPVGYFDTAMGKVLPSSLK